MNEHVENHWSFIGIQGRSLTPEENDKEWMNMSKEAERNSLPIEQVYLNRIENNQYDMPSEEIYQELKKTAQENESLVTRLSLFFKDEGTARRFLSQIKNIPKETERIILVKRYCAEHLCTGCKGLWNALRDLGMYTKGYTNWNQQLNIR